MDENKRINFNDIFKSVFHIQLSERTIGEIEYTLEEYKEFMTLLEQLSPNNYKLLYDALKYDEILYNHSMEIPEKENSLLLENMNNPEIRKDSIKYISEKQLGNERITIPNIKHLHSILMKGVSVDEEGNKKFRINDEIFVGYYENGEKRIQYLPPKSRDVDFSMQEVLALLNDPMGGTTEEQLLVHPAIVHALIAII